MLNTDGKHFQGITELSEWCWTKSRPDREVHQFVNRHLMGEYHPSVWGHGIETSVPLLSMASRATARHMVSKAPRGLATVDDPQLKSMVETQQIRTNQRIRKSNLAEELRETANQSLSSFGTLFLAPQFIGTPNGMRLDLRAEAIDRCRFFHDVRSSSLEGADIQGHEFEMPLVDIQENPIFDPAARMEVREDGHKNGRGESANVRENQSNDRPDLYKYVTVRCVYEQRRRKLFYFPRHQPRIKLAEVDWQGPDHGPYRFLWFERPPGNGIPTAPLVHLLKTHRTFNTLDVRAMHQQQVAKALLAYTNASKSEAETIINSFDLQSVLMENGNMRWIHVGGADPNTVAMAEKNKRDFSYASSGIVDQFIKQADTLGQERLLKAAANEMLDDLSGTTYQFVKGVFEDWFWFDVRDPDQAGEYIRKSIPGMDHGSYSVLWTPEHRRFVASLDTEIDIEPYSYVERSPQSRLADLLGALQLLMGMMEVLAAQGISIDAEAVVNTIAAYKNLPELHEWLILNQDPERLQGLLGARGQQRSPMDMGGPKRYIRTSESDGAGADMEIMRMFNRNGQQRKMA